jgi:hypothetical protein
MKKQPDSIYRLWQPLKKWINKLLNRKDDDDNQFNHPYVIF